MYLICIWKICIFINRMIFRTKIVPWSRAIHPQGSRVLRNTNSRQPIPPKSFKHTGFKRRDVAKLTRPASNHSVSSEQMFCIDIILPSCYLQFSARFEAERGCVLNSGPGGTISCNCVSNLCNVYTKCHQCFGSLGKCDSTRIDYRIPGTDCVNEFLRPRERLSTSSRNEIGVAHMCSMLLSEQVVSRVCTPIMDFGTGLGSLYFLTEQPATFELPWYVPAPCNRWAQHCTSCHQ